MKIKNKKQVIQDYLDNIANKERYKAKAQKKVAHWDKLIRIDMNNLHTFLNQFIEVGEELILDNNKIKLRGGGLHKSVEIEKVKVL